MLIKERIYELFVDFENVTLHFWINKDNYDNYSSPKEGAKTKMKLYTYAKDCKEIQPVHPEGNPGIQEFRKS